MFEGKHIQVGAGRYIQCHGALKRAGEEMVFFRKEGLPAVRGRCGEGKDQPGPGGKPQGIRNYISVGDI